VRATQILLISQADGFQDYPDIPPTLHSTMSNDGDPSVTIYQHYCPQGVKRVLASGSSAFIGEVDDSTVFKYPLAPGGEMSRLEIEGKLLQIVGQHERIIGLKGISETGLYLERAENGTVADYILTSDRSPLLKQRLTWCREATEAVAWIHARRILHCDIQPTNLLLDKKRRTARLFLTAGAASLAGSTARETILLTRTSRQTSLRWGAPFTSS
jgi:serine/threonine protein kinase